MTFEECCSECIANKELLREYNRLKVTHLGGHRDGITKAIDDACGYDPDVESIPEFVKFVYECVWLPLCLQEEKKQNSSQNLRFMNKLKKGI